MKGFKKGDELPPITIPEITAEHISHYAEGSGDYASIHLDKSAAQEAGFARPIAHGMWSMALGGKLVSKWLSSNVLVTSYNVSFITPVMIGDSLIVKGHLLDVDQGSAEIKVKGVNQREETVIKGTMVVKG
ncbi:MaoC family dehydratase [Pontibacillus marinus]|uniref:MaoC family dehydratase n=1 Tax=Pontibacillus marinus BH030004 = DSM 16465 TaxID=1385511 RepID=A0A0A5G8J1_9BACI|nr:MaoC/PaaZ C-terminal domain-containing protein [Pontibacillus marinus]KGX89451.1 MaoC family dehydratase [Pontibacillus marinus BH030004 = DSM 16465]